MVSLEEQFLAKVKLLNIQETEKCYSNNNDSSSNKDSLWHFDSGGIMPTATDIASAFAIIYCYCMVIEGTRPSYLGAIEKAQNSTNKLLAL